MNVVRFSAGLVVLVVVVLPRSTDSAPLPQSYKNLTVLPKDVSGPVLIETMKGFTRALGVRCEHCHVGEGNDLSKFDFPADTKPTKITARKMMLMLTTINQQVADLGEPSPSPKVSCYSCHRGALKPLTERPAGVGE